MSKDKKKEKKSGSSKASIKYMNRLVVHIVKGYKVPCVLIVICILLSALATLAMTLFTQSLIDDYITPMMDQTDPDYAPLATQLMKLAAVLGIGTLCSFAYNRLAVTVSQGTLKRLRTSLFENMESLPLKYFDTNAHGDIMSVYTNDIDTLRQYIGQSMPTIINSAITLISTFISMIVLDIPMTLISCAMVGVMLVTTSKLSDKSEKYFVEQQNDLGNVNGYIEELMDGQKVVKVFCHEEQTVEDFKVLNRKLRESAKNANAISNMTMPANSNLGNISYVLCAIIGGALALKGDSGLTVGTLVAFLSLNKNFSNPVTQISQQMSYIIQAAAGSERVFNMLDEIPESDEGTVELVNASIDENGNISEAEERTGTWAWKRLKEDGTAAYSRLEGKVSLVDVTFGYNDDRMVLHDIDVDAKPGQKLAFVGGTGAGKTTIINLINRFYDVQEGKVLYDDIDVMEIKKGDLRRSLGMVLQDTHLFTGTVMENIRYGRLDATDDECKEAAALANADSFIKRLPDGYDTMLTNDGENLSQGQRQLLAIARAAVADPPALILDEATSSIDTRTEVLVQQGMDSLMEGRTSFVIAHRLSTIKNSDCIMVMEQGRIIERGSHDELLEKKGKYYQLYTGKTA